MAESNTKMKFTGKGVKKGTKRTEAVDSNPELNFKGKTTGVLYKVDGSIEAVEGKFDGDRLREVIECSMFQMVPFTQGKFARKMQLWIDEEGQFKDDPLRNAKAEAAVGNQVYGGELYGNVLVVKHSAVD